MTVPQPAAPGGPHPGSRLLGILVTYRRPAELAHMLDALAAQDAPLAHLFVVDNSPGPSSEAEVDRYAAAGHPVTYVPAPENLGPAGAIALGMEGALALADDDDWIVLFDDGEPPYRDSLLGELHAFAEATADQHPATGAVGLVGSRLDPARGRLLRVPDEELHGAVPVSYVGGGQFPLYRVRAVRATGSFCGPLFFGFDDLEYGVRLRRGGWSLFACGPLWLERRADEGRLGMVRRPSARLAADAQWRCYYSLRNLLHVLREDGRWAAAARVTLVQGLLKPLTNLAVQPRDSWRSLRLNARACRDGWLGRLGRRVEPDQ